MRMRWRDREEAAALLAGIAALRLGEERAAAIGDELQERAGQLWRLAQEPLALGDEPAWEADAVQEATSGDVLDGFAAVRAGEPAAIELLDACRRRIQRLDPTLHAWAALDLDAAERTAAAMDGAVGATAQWPLAGAPVGVKDVFLTAGLPTRAGSALLANQLVATAGGAPAGDGGGDAAAVARLRRAGAVVVGKTACTELALNDPAPTRNPWDPTRTPGGSSAGSAVAVATGMCMASLDTQTAGDILRPAAYNGVVGFKPTYGTIPRQGIVPVAWSIDTVGVQTRRVQDAALLFAVLAGRYAPGAAAGTVGGPAAWSRPPRLGLVRDPLLDGADAEAQAATTRALAMLGRAGAHTTEVWLDGALELARAAHRVVAFCECAAVHEELLDRHAEQLGPKARTLLELGAVTPATGYLHAQRLRRRLAVRLQASFQEEGVEALVTPTTTGPAPADLATTGDSSLQIPWTFVGLPAISLPVGVGEAGMPLAVQLIGAPNADERLLAVARWCEQVLNLDLHPPLA
jgi:Asp-tRNA(Asn)/Glu-tRNA(Gln) amidotransferase A subunit family amidase